MIDIQRVLSVIASRAPKVRADDPGHLARIEAHAERVASECPPPETRPHCYCCGVPSPNGNRIARIGWRSRPLRDKPDVNETYCAGCFGVWGFGDEPTGLEDAA